MDGRVNIFLQKWVGAWERGGGEGRGNVGVENNCLNQLNHLLGCLHQFLFPFLWEFEGCPVCRGLALIY